MLKPPPARIDGIANAGTIYNVALFRNSIIVRGLINAKVSLYASTKYFR
jgi:hypothetical protein